MNNRRSQDAICNLVKIEEIFFILSAVSFICIHLLDAISGMTTAGDTQREISAVNVFLMETSCIEYKTARGCAKVSICK